MRGLTKGPHAHANRCGWLVEGVARPPPVVSRRRKKKIGMPPEHKLLLHLCMRGNDEYTVYASYMTCHPQRLCLRFDFASGLGMLVLFASIARKPNSHRSM